MVQGAQFSTRCTVWYKVHSLVQGAQCGTRFTVWYKVHSLVQGAQCGPTTCTVVCEIDMYTCKHDILTCSRAGRRTCCRKVNRINSSSGLATE